MLLMNDSISQVSDRAIEYSTQSVVPYGSAEHQTRKFSRRQMRTILEALKQTINETKVKIEYESATDCFKISVRTAKVIHQLAANERGDKAMYDSINMNRIRHQAADNVVVTTSTSIARSALGIQKDDIFQMFANTDAGVESDSSQRSALMTNIMQTLSDLPNVLNNMPCNTLKNNPKVLNFLTQGRALPAIKSYEQPQARISELEDVILYNTRHHAQVPTMQIEPSRKMFLEEYENVGMLDSKMPIRQKELENIKFEVDDNIFKMFDIPRQHNTVRPEVDVEDLANTLKNIHIPPNVGHSDATQIMSSELDMLAIEWK